MPSLRHALCAVLLGAPLAAQTTLVAIPADRDATLYDLSADVSNGGGQSLFLGDNALGETRRVLLHFDVQAAVPPGALVVSAELLLSVAQSNAAAPELAALYRVTDDWGEGTVVAPGQGGAGGPAQAGDATWRHRSYPTATWANPGGDVAAGPSAVVDVPTTGIFAITSNRFLIDDVRSWAQGWRPNHGWMLQMVDEATTGTARRLHSRESAFVGVEPLLTIEYLAPGASVRYGTGCVGSNGLAFQQVFQGQPAGGSQVTLGMTQGLPGGLGVTLISLGILPSPIPLGPGCEFFLLIGQWPTFGWRVLDNTGSSLSTYPIPPDPNLNGSAWALQSVGFDQGVPRGYVVSNAHLFVFL